MCVVTTITYRCRHGPKVVFENCGVEGCIYFTPRAVTVGSCGEQGCTTPPPSP